MAFFFIFLFYCLFFINFYFIIYIVFKTIEIQTFGFDQDLSDLMKDKSGSRWGNKFGMILLPVYYHKSGSDPLQYLKRAKVMIDQKKQSLEAHFSYKIGYFVMSSLGSKVDT
jgi:hypothetical protein